MADGQERAFLGAVRAAPTPVAPRIATSPRARSMNQDIRTPAEVVNAVENRFGQIVLDLAAKDGDEVRPGMAHITPEQDSLKTPWPTRRHVSGVYWLNPPFADIGPWAVKCVRWMREANPGVALALLVPASVGASWWQHAVRGCAIVYAVTPRITFVGSMQPYPKDLALAIYDPRHQTPDASVLAWRWKP